MENTNYSSDEEYEISPKPKKMRKAFKIYDGCEDEDVENESDENNPSANEKQVSQKPKKVLVPQESGSESDKEDNDEEISDDEVRDLYGENSEHSEENSNSENDESEENTDDGEENRDVNVALDKKQTQIIDYVEKLLKDKKFRKSNPNIVIISGTAGTGKTTVLQALYNYVQFNLGLQVLCIASSGVAALKYDTGRTAHSIFKFPLNISDINNDCDINDYDQQVSGASIIIYDAANTVDVRNLEMLDRALQNLMGTKQTFGGKIIVFGVDFLELGPISPGANDQIAFSIKFAPVFNETNTKTFPLKKSYRAKRDAEHFQFIKKLGCGLLPERQSLLNPNEKFVPLEDIKFTDKLDELLDFVYPDEILDDSDSCAKRVILAPTITQANEINSLITNKIDKKIVTCSAIDDFQEYDILEEYLTEIDKTLEDKVYPDANLKLWKGCLCMVVQTMYQPSTLLVGAKVIVKEILPDFIVVRRPGSNEEIFIERKYFTFRKFGKECCREQFPLKLCYATTIHKSQGQTLERVGVDLRRPVFRHGQLYLALSRVRNSEDLKVCVDKVYKGVPYAVNIVARRLVPDKI